MITRILLGLALLPFLAPVITGCADTEVRQLTLPDQDTYCDIVGNTISCPDGSELTLEEEVGASIISLIYPCEDTANHQELLLRLSTGEIIAVFDGDTKNNPGQTRLTTLNPGNYVTTDQNNNGNRCRFTVTDSLEVIPSLEVEL